MWVIFWSCVKSSLIPARSFAVGSSSLLRAATRQAQAIIEGGHMVNLYSRAHRAMRPWVLRLVASHRSLTSTVATRWSSRLRSRSTKSWGVMAHMSHLSRLNTNNSHVYWNKEQKKKYVITEGQFFDTRPPLYLSEANEVGVFRKKKNLRRKKKSRGKKRISCWADGMCR